MARLSATAARLFLGLVLAGAGCNGNGTGTDGDSDTGGGDEAPIVCDSMPDGDGLAGDTFAGDAFAGDTINGDNGPPPGDDDPAWECVDHPDCLGYRRCENHVCTDAGPSSLAGTIILNEILIDGTVDADANDDGDIQGTEDEFLEIINIGVSEVDLAGFVIVETDHLAVVRHTFGAGVTLPAGHALVIFGGGTPSANLESTPNAQFTVANALDPAFSNGLNLDDSGDWLRLLDPELRVVFAFGYGDGCAAGPCYPAASDHSLTRDPDLTGDFVAHDTATGAAGAVISVGTRVDGTSF